MRFVGRVFDQLGIKRIAKQDKAPGKRTYELDPDVLATVKAYAARYVARERARIAAVAGSDEVTAQPESVIVTQPATPARKAVSTNQDGWQAWPCGAVDTALWEISPDLTRIRPKVTVSAST